VSGAIKVPDFRRIDTATAKVDAAIRSRGAAPASTPADTLPDAVILRRGSTLTPEAVRWLWTHWLAVGKFHVLAGPPGQGKTTIALACVATVTAGGRWPDGSVCDPGNVLIWSGEDDPKDTLLPRLMAMGADVSRVYFIESTRVDGKAEAFDPARDMPALLTEAERIGDVRLLIVDPVVSAVAGDSHKNGEVRRALQPLVDLASALQTAVLGISHFSKGSGGRDPVERVTGSLAFGALARVVLCAVKVKGTDGDDDRRILARAKSNIGPDDGGFEYGIEQVSLDGFPDIDASVIRWGRALEGSARELLAEAETEDDEAEPARDVDAFVLGCLADGPRSAGAMKKDADGAGFAWRTVQRARKRLGVKAEKVGMSGGWVWAIPAGTKAPSREDATEGAEGVNLAALAPLAPSGPVVAPLSDCEVF
jgi:putative DNA primase/helicase